MTGAQLGRFNYHQQQKIKWTSLLLGENLCGRMLARKWHHRVLWPLTSLRWDTERKMQWDLLVWLPPHSLQGKTIRDCKINPITLKTSTSQSVRFNYSPIWTFERLLTYRVFTLYLQKKLHNHKHRQWLLMLLQGTELD